MSRWKAKGGIFRISLTLVSPARWLISFGVLAMALVGPVRATEKLPAHPKLVYRQIGGGYTLALELNRRPKTFFLCAPNKTDCISVAAIGWRKPFIIHRTGGVAPGVTVYDTESKKGMFAAEQSKLPTYLRNLPLDPASVAWEKLSATRPAW